MGGKCHFCCKITELQLSHLIPSFIFKWKKKQGTGFFRTSQNPNKRVQDGEKLHLLCSDCEQTFAVWEKHFAENLFKPFHINSATQLEYGDWALRFAVSISWRVLIYHKLNNGLTLFSANQIKLVKEALNTWWHFLKENHFNLANFEQHMFPVDIIQSNKSDTSISPYLNRYFVGSVDFDVIRTPNTALVLTKLNKLVVIGVIQKPCEDYFEGTKIDSPVGEFGPKKIVIPEQLFKYFNVRASKAAESLSSLTEKQWKVINSSYEKDIERLKNADIYVAADADQTFSGQNAIDILKPKSGENKEANVGCENLDNK